MFLLWHMTSQTIDTQRDGVRSERGQKAGRFICTYLHLDLDHYNYWNFARKCLAAVLLVTCHSRTKIAADTMRLMSKGRSVSLSWILVDALLGISPLVNNFMQNSSSTDMAMVLVFLFWWCWWFKSFTHGFSWRFWGMGTGWFAILMPFSPVTSASPFTISWNHEASSPGKVCCLHGQAFGKLEGKSCRCCCSDRCQDTYCINNLAVCIYL